MEISERIKSIIDFYQYSSSEFADTIEVPRSSISHITSGRNKPSLDFMMKIKNRFPELQWEWLLDGQGDMTTKSEKANETFPIPKLVEEEIVVEKPETSPLDLFAFLSDKKEEIPSVEQIEEIPNLPESAPVIEHQEETVVKESQPLALQENKSVTQLPDNKDKKIKRIVFFYEDGTFEAFVQ